MSEIRRGAELAGRAKPGAAASVRYSKSQLSRGLAASAGVSRDVGSRLLHSVETSGQLLRRAKHASNLEDETLELLADGSGEVAEGYRQATLRAAVGDDVASYAQIDRAVRKIDDLDEPAKSRAQRPVRETDGASLRVIDELDPSTVERLSRAYATSSSTVAIFGGSQTDCTLDRLIGQRSRLRSHERAISRPMVTTSGESKRQTR